MVGLWTKRSTCPVSAQDCDFSYASLYPSLLAVQWAEAQSEGEQELLSVNSGMQITQKGSALLGTDCHRTMSLPCLQARGKHRSPFSEGVQCHFSCLFSPTAFCQ